MSFCHEKTFLRFSQRTCPIHYFRSQTHVWGGFAQFRCRTSPIPKTGVRVRTNTSFRHRNHFFIFHNEHAQSTTLGPKLMIGVVSRNFVAACHPFLKWLSGCTRSTSFGHRNHFFVSCNEHAQSTTLGPELMFVVVSRNFVAARHPFRKWVSRCIQSMSLSDQNHFFVFRNEHAQTNNLGPKLMLGWFRAISLPHVTHSENGSRGVHTKHEISPTEPFLHFLQRTCRIHYFRSKTHVWGGFAQFRCRMSPIPKMVVGCIQSTSFRPRNLFFIFRKEHAQSTTLGPKLMIGVVSRNFVATRHPFLKWLSGASKAPVFATGTIYSFFATNMPNSLI
jgi:hypothetical protein